MENVGCEGKYKYATSAKATRSAKSVNRRNDGLRMNAYKCKTCGWWHVGHSSRRRVRWATRMR